MRDTGLDTPEIGLWSLPDRKRVLTRALVRAWANTQVCDSLKLKNLFGKDSEPIASVFVIEAWAGKRWRLVAQSDYEAAAFRLFHQASYACPVATLLRLRRGSEVWIKMPADGRGNVRESRCPRALLPVR